MPEVLVAILVLAIGIVGAAGAQVAALRARHGSALLSNAVQLASSLAERMRANPAQMQVPDSLNPYLQLDYDVANGAPPAAATCFADASCASAQLAAFDIGEAMAMLERDFPGGHLRVCRDGAAGDDWVCHAGPGAPIVIKVGWLRRQGDGRWVATPAVFMVAAGAPS